MSFTGTPVIEQITPNLVRITGIDLASEVAGTIGFEEATGTPPDIFLPGFFEAPSITFQNNPVPLQASIRVSIEPVSALGLTNLPPSIAKTGTTKEDFRITVTNTRVGLGTQTLEIYVESQAIVTGRSVQIGPINIA